LAEVSIAAKHANAAHIRPIAKSRAPNAVFGPTLEAGAAAADDEEFKADPLAARDKQSAAALD
jgi:hypothetical protein